MPEIIVKRSRLQGNVDAPASKSYSHRAIICASLAEGKSKIIDSLDCNDILETIHALEKFGVKFERKGDSLEITGGVSNPTEMITFYESGTSYRFIVALASLVPGEVLIKVRGRLMERPIEIFLQALLELGVKCSLEGGEIRLRNCTSGGGVKIPGNVSSQFISGLLLIAPLLENGLEIELTTEAESLPYVDITIDTMADFGVYVERVEKGFIVHKQDYKAREYRIEGDFSSAAFLLAGGAINGDIKVRNIKQDSKQGDRRILDILREMGADIKVGENAVRVKESTLSGMEISARDIPDLVPVCSVLGCFAKGETRIVDAARLRKKESDRLFSLSMELRKMSALIREGDDNLTIGKSDLKGAEIDPHNDHRVAMACTIAGLSAGGDTTIKNPDCVRKSYPKFFQDLKRLGAKIENGIPSE